MARLNGARPGATWIVSRSRFPLAGPGDEVGRLQAPDRMTALREAERTYGPHVVVEPATTGMTASSAGAAMLAIGRIFAREALPVSASLSHAVSHAIAILVLAGAGLVLAGLAHRWRLAHRRAGRVTRRSV